MTAVALDGVIQEIETSSEGKAIHRWKKLDADTFDVRNATFTSDWLKHKEPSKSAFYECVEIKGFLSPLKPSPSIVELIPLPPVPPELEEKAKSVGLPLHIVATYCYPRYSSSHEKKNRNGESTTFFVVLRVTANAIAQLESNPSNAATLLQRFFADTENMYGRLKMVQRVPQADLDELWDRRGNMLLRPLLRFNGTPALCNNKHYVNITKHREGELQQVYFDYHCHIYIVRKALNYFKNTMHDFVLDFMLVIEGRDCNELPEQILACFQTYRLDASQLQCVEWPEIKTAEPLSREQIIALRAQLKEFVPAEPPPHPESIVPLSETDFSSGAE